MPVLAPTAVAAGLYTDIVNIIAPGSAPAGNRVDVTVKVKNIDPTFYHWVACVAIYDGSAHFIDQEAFLAPKETHSFSGRFTMPNKAVTITAYSYYDYYGEWISDDEAEKDVNVEKAWQKLATKTITITPVFLPWQKLATKTITITPIVVWQKLASKTITVTPKLEWIKLATKTVTIEPTVVGWVKLATKTIILSPVEIPPEYKLIQHTEYPRGKTYVGKAEQCTFEFKLTPEQIPITPWLGVKIANALADKVIKEGSEMLNLKVYEDTTPMLWTNYIVVATATASPVPWTIIIVAVLAILFVVAITFLIREIKTIDWGEIAPAVFPILAVVLGIAAVATVAIVASKKKRGEV